MYPAIYLSIYLCTKCVVVVVVVVVVFATRNIPEEDGCKIATRNRTVENNLRAPKTCK